MKKFRGKKVYGQSKQDFCSFCGSIATQTTPEGILVCRHHIQNKMAEIRCICGRWLEQRSGKFGPYFNCINCGNINFNKALEMKSLMPQERTGQDSGIKTGQDGSSKSDLITPAKKDETFEEREKRIAWSEKKERTITSDDVEYFD